jgi:hypothetical protein
VLEHHWFSQQFYDIQLLARRNGIAHGEDTLVGLQEMDNLAETTIGLMRQFGDLLENKIVSKNYRAATAL